jgi:hypothetical protein
MRKKVPELTPVDRSLVEQVAGIIGVNSAAAAALKKADEWIAGAPGRTARFFTSGSSFVVEPVE